MKTFQDLKHCSSFRKLREKSRRLKLYLKSTPKLLTSRTSTNLLETEEPTSSPSISNIETGSNPTEEGKKDEEGSTFHLFPHLPPELRTKIWRLSLPFFSRLIEITYSPVKTPTKFRFDFTLHWKFLPWFSILVRPSSISYNVPVTLPIREVTEPSLLYVCKESRKAVLECYDLVWNERYAGGGKRDRFCMEVDRIRIVSQDGEGCFLNGVVEKLVKNLFVGYEGKREFVIEGEERMRMVEGMGREGVFYWVLMGKEVVRLYNDFERAMAVLHDRGEEEKVGFWEDIRGLGDGEEKRKGGEKEEERRREVNCNCFFLGERRVGWRMA